MRGLWRIWRCKLLIIVVSDVAGRYQQRRWREVCVALLSCLGHVCCFGAGTITVIMIVVRINFTAGMKNIRMLMMLLLLLRLLLLSWAEELWSPALNAAVVVVATVAFRRLDSDAAVSGEMCGTVVSV